VQQHAQWFADHPHDQAPSPAPDLVEANRLTLAARSFEVAAADDDLDWWVDLYGDESSPLLAVKERLADLGVQKSQPLADLTPGQKAAWRATNGGTKTTTFKEADAAATFKEADAAAHDALGFRTFDMADALKRDVSCGTRQRVRVLVGVRRSRSRGPQLRPGRCCARRVPCIESDDGSAPPAQRRRREGGLRRHAAAPRCHRIADRERQAVAG